MPSKTASITITIHLDNNNAPERIEWQADGDHTKEMKATKSVMISLWDDTRKNTVRFDLWTREMMQHEMAIHVFQSLLLMAESYQRATGNRELGEFLHQNAEEFGIKANIIKRAPSEDNQTANHSDDDDNSPITPFNLNL